MMDAFNVVGKGNYDPEGEVLRKAKKHFSKVVHSKFNMSFAPTKLKKLGELDETTVQRMHHLMEDSKDGVVAVYPMHNYAVQHDKEYLPIGTAITFTPSAALTPLAFGPADRICECTMAFRVLGGRDVTTLAHDRALMTRINSNLQQIISRRYAREQAGNKNFNGISFSARGIYVDGASSYLDSQKQKQKSGRSRSAASKFDDPFVNADNKDTRWWQKLRNTLLNRNDTQHWEAMLGSSGHHFISLGHDDKDVYIIVHAGAQVSSIELAKLIAYYQQTTQGEMSIQEFLDRYPWYEMHRDNVERNCKRLGYIFAKELGLKIEVAPDTKSTLKDKYMEDVPRMGIPAITQFSNTMELLPHLRLVPSAAPLSVNSKLTSTDSTSSSSSESNSNSGVITYDQFVSREFASATGGDKSAASRLHTGSDVQSSTSSSDAHHHASDAFVADASASRAPVFFNACSPNPLYHPFIKESQLAGAVQIGGSVKRLVPEKDDALFREFTAAHPHFDAKVVQEDALTGIIKHTVIPKTPLEHRFLIVNGTQEHGSVYIARRLFVDEECQHSVAHTKNCAKQAKRDSPAFIALPTIGAHADAQVTATTVSATNSKEKRLSTGAALSSRNNKKAASRREETDAECCSGDEGTIKYDDDDDAKSVVSTTSSSTSSSTSSVSSAISSIFSSHQMIKESVTKQQEELQKEAQRNQLHRMTYLYDGMDQHQQDSRLIGAHVNYQSFQHTLLPQLVSTGVVPAELEKKHEFIGAAIGSSLGLVIPQRVSSSKAELRPLSMYVTKLAISNE